MRQNQSRRFVIITASALLVIVCLLAFGEQARHGRYHLDGGRGWDLPPATSLDAGHIQLSRPISSRVVVLFDLKEAAPVTFLDATELPLPKAATPLIGFDLRSPPAV